MNPGELIAKLREEIHLTPTDVERRSADIANKLGNESMFVSHSQLHQIETENSIPGVYKMCSLATCLGTSLEDLLCAYGIDASTLRQEYGFRLSNVGSSTYENQQNIRNLWNIVSNFEKTGLLDRDLQERYLLPMFAKGLEEKYRFTFGVIGTEDGESSDPVPPGAILQIDRKYNSANSFSQVRPRPICFVWCDKGFLCGWFKSEGRNVTVVPFSPEREMVHLKIPRDAEIVGRVISIFRFFLGPSAANSEA